MKTVATDRRQTVPARKPRFKAGMFLEPFQRYINDQSVVVVMRGSRRVGKDYADAFKTVSERLSGRRTVDLNYASRDEDTAREYLEYVRYFCHMAGLLAEAVWDVELFDTRAIKTGRVEFPEINGKRPVVRVLSSAPGSFRGRDGDIVLSEIAFHERPRELWGAAAPTATLGGRVRVVSTVNAEGDFFEQLCDMGRRRAEGTPRPGDMPVSLHTVTIHDAVAAGLVEQTNRVRGTKYTRDSFLAEVRAKCLDQDQWEREYECKPSSEASSYFPFALTRTCLDREAPAPTGDTALFIAGVAARAGSLKPDAVYAGMDIGRRRDLTVVWALGRVGAAYHTLGVLTLENTPFAAQYAAVKGLLDGFAVRRLCADETGLGMQIVEQLSARYRSRVEGVSITAKVKGDIYPGLRRCLEERTVTLPDCEATLADLASVRKEITSAGNVRYAGERNEHGHADRACALALALHAAESRKGYGYCVRTLSGADP